MLGRASEAKFGQDWKKKVAEWEGKKYLVLLGKFLLLIIFLTPPSLQAKSMSYVVIKLIDLGILQRKQLSMLYVSEE